MATYENTTGWYQDLERWWASDERRALEAEVDRHNPPLSSDKIILFVELMLKTPECVEAMKSILAWYDDHPGEDPDDHGDTFPFMKRRLLGFFKQWFDWKEQQWPRSKMWSLDQNLFVRAVRGELDMGDHDAVAAIVKECLARYKDIFPDLK